ncbi:hypothetical protein SADUNF_Sadunf08G0041300 [Salix dunnii]|uniref:Dolichyl-diphosphooligosaccharide--protein glycosyltransferase subunit 4A n=1 Tax=Salix dunnii TaxID=1413687 RepID=A0A835MTB0_9ROSI|nr:hypothetical protein SADUNF_Sadunf08G0041300 [Salix dunnii]
MFDDQDLGFFANFLGIFIFVLVIAYHYVMADPNLWSLFEPSSIRPAEKMFDDQDLGFFANFLGIFIFVLVIAYHYVMADPKYEGN